jgi:hypothetical protein
VYPYEHESLAIFAYERLQAEKEEREPRLKPFSFHMSWDRKGPHVRDSQNCKSQILSLLGGVLEKESIDLLTEHGKHPTMPLMSGPGEDLYLHCMGPLSFHQKKSGQRVYFHDFFGYGTPNEVACYFTIPPQLLVGTEDAKQLFKIDEVFIERIKSVVAKLQRIRWVLLNGGFPENLGLVQQVTQCYEAFSDISSKKAESSEPLKWSEYSYTLFFSRELVQGCKQLTQAEQLLELIYQDIEAAGELGCISLETAGRSGAVLSKKNQKEMCIILGKSYPQSIWDEEDYEIASRFAY